MPVAYNGNASFVTNAGRPTVDISIPLGTDPPNAASVNTAFQRLADWVKSLMTRVGLLDTASNWTALQNFTFGMVASATASVPGVQALSGQAGQAAITGANSAGGAAATFSGSGASTPVVTSTATGAAPAVKGIGGTGAAVEAGTGDLLLSASIPAQTDQRPKVLSRRNRNLAWAYIELNSGVITVRDSYGIQIAADTNPPAIRSDYGVTNGNLRIWWRTPLQPPNAYWGMTFGNPAQPSSDVVIPQLLGAGGPFFDIGLHQGSVAHADANVDLTVGFQILVFSIDGSA